MKRTITKMLSCRGWMPLMVLFCLLSNSGQVWAGGHSSHTGTGTVYTNGNGKVYASSNSASPEGGKGWSSTDANTTAIIEFSCNKTESNDGWKDAYALSDPNDGYYLEGWYTNAARSQEASNGNHMQVGVNTGRQTSTYPSTLYAKFAAIPVTAPTEVTGVTNNPTTTKPGDVTFRTKYEYATKDDFNKPSFTAKAGGEWTVTSWDVANGNIIVNYSFRANESTGNYPTETTLKVESKGGLSASVTIPANVIAAENFDAGILDADGNVIDDSKGDLATVLTNAAAGQTVRILRNVNLGANKVTITKSLTLDLNDYAINGTAAGMITINGTGIEVTIKDKDGGHGSINTEASLAGDLSAIKITKGTLTLLSGIIDCNNTSTDNNNARTFGVDIAAGAEFVMKGGAINADCASSKGSYGIYERGTATTSGSFVMNGGTITANGQGSVRGVLIYGTMVMNDGATIKAPGVSGIGIMVHVSGSNGPGALTMNGGVIEGLSVGVQVSTAACKATINNGSVKGAKALNIAEANTTGMVVKGGMFEGTITTKTNGILKGGYYTAQPAAAAIATNYLSYATLDGTAIKDAGYLYGVGGSEEGAIVCKVIDGTAKTTTFFSSIASAIDYVNQNSNNTTTIILTANCTLPAGYYTLPAKATLLVPNNGSRTTAIGEKANLLGAGTYTTPSLYCKLNISNGAHMDVWGTIEVSCDMFNNSQGANGSGIPSGKYGQVQMEEGSSMNLLSGAILQAWGFITGKGEIDVRRGAKVHEMFQVYDWKGGSASSGLVKNEQHAFIVTQYYIQNIEVPIKFRPGSRELGSFAVHLSKYGIELDGVTDEIGIIGLRNKKDGSADDIALFQMDDYDDSDDTWVTKDYNEEKDRQEYIINSAASLSSMKINVSTTLASVNVNSQDYVLPITNNMTIHLLSGEMRITQDVELLPGAAIENDKESTVIIESGKTLYLYDSDDWGAWAYSNGYSNPVKYTPSWSKCPRSVGSAAALGDSKLYLHGSMEINGFLRTTSGGAQIYSNVSGAGTITYKQAAPVSGNSVDIYQISGTNTPVPKEAYAAVLRNEDSLYPTTTTAGTAAGTSFCYLDIDGNGGKWTSLTTDGCFAVDEANDIIYAKPGSYVAITSKTEDANHLYHSVTGDRLFIVLHETYHKGCQWWEVEQTEEDDAVYYCSDNDTYYYYDGSKWAVKKITITWLNYDGNPVRMGGKDQVYSVPFGSKPQYLGTNPTKPATTYYTYAFTGWLPEITEDTRVFEDATYVAQYEQHEIRYTVTFKDENGKTIETQFVKVGEVPVCSFQPTKQGYYLYWKTDDANAYPIAAVSKNVTYKAYYEEIPKTTFKIIFQNYNGTILKQADNSTNAIYEVEEGIKPAFTGSTPTKASTQDREYSFAGWTPDITPATEDITYVAKFEESPRKYQIDFKGQDGIIFETQMLGYGEVPICQNPPTKRADEKYYYTVKWDKDISAVTSSTIYTVDGFTAHKNTLRMTVAAEANGSVEVKMGEISQELSAIYDYGTELVVTATPNSHYQFKQWSDGNMDNPRTITLTEPKNIQAQFELQKMTITWKVDEQVIATSQVDYGTIPTYTGATPNKPSICGFYFTFAGWSPAFTTATGAQTYTAQFNKIANPSLIAYQVIFNGNGATNGTMPNQGFDAGVSQKLDANAYVNARTVTFNYNGNGQAATTAQSAKAFLGWQDANDGSKTYGDGQVVYNLAPDCEHATITLNAQWDANYAAITLPAPTKTIVGKKFDGWYTAPTGGTKVGGGGDSYAPNADITLYAQWKEPRMENTTITNDVILPAGEYNEENVTIKITGSLTVPSTASLRVNTLILEATETTSGQVIPYDARSLSAENVYFDFTFINAAPMKWYAFAVPFEVESNAGVNAGEMERDYDIIEYHGDVRATKGADRSAWDYVAKNATLVPGKFYMILFAKATTTVRFTKKSGSPILNTETPGLYIGGEGTDANWNGIANPSTYHTNVIPTSVTEGQVYVSETGQYETKTLSSYELTVGRPIFIQATTADPVILTTPSASAPARVMESRSIDQFDLYISPVGAENSSDRLIVKASEDATGEYTIVADLAKAGVSSKVAQMWTNAYGTRLCKQTAQLINNNATYSLGLYAPTAGEYTLNVGDMPQDGSQLYLTYDDQPIWNLNMGEYTLPLSQGTNNGYGLQLVGPSHVATDVENAGESIVNGNQKIVLNNKLYIITNSGIVYDAQGKTVKNHRK